MSKKKFSITSTKDLMKAMVDGLKIDTSVNTVEWVLKNQIKTEDGLPISFDERRFLIDLINDDTPKQAVMSSAQVGKTVTAYIKALYMNFKGLNVALSQPTQDLRDMLTKSKLNRIIEANELFRHNVTGGLDMKTAWDRMLFLVYTYGNAQVGYTTDLNIYDEVSRSNPETISILKGRQLNSKYKHEIFISNPNVPNDLLHNTFLDSDQKHWAIKCQCCSKRQILNYDGLYGYKGNVNKETAQFHCQYCDGVLDPKTIIEGEWVARYQNRKDISGYWISQLMRPTHSLIEQQALVKEMLYEEKKSKATFMNMYLGMPYSGSEVQVDKALLMKNLTTPTKFKHYVTMGLDVGSATGHHFVIGSNGVVFKLGRAKDWKEVRKLINDYGVQILVCDNMPENGSAKELQAEYPNIVWRANYVGNKSEEQIRYDEETGLVNIARNLIFDNIVNDLNEGKYKFAFHRDDAEFNELCKHFGTLSKIAKFDSVGNPTFSWVAPEGAWDHYSHSFLYWTIAEHRLSELTPRFGIGKRDDGEFKTPIFEPRNMSHFDQNKPISWLDL